MIRIITDSATDITQAEAAALLVPDVCSVQVLPLSVTFGTTTYRDGVDLTHDRFYELLVEKDELPVTGQVTPFGYSQAIDAVFADPANANDDVLIITLSSKLSGTHQSAVVAAQEAVEAGRSVRVVDSLNVCVGQRILVELAVELAKFGTPADELADVLEQRRGDIRLVALLDTLEYLRRGGRVSGLAAGLGAMLSIKPVVGVEGGEVKVLGKARGSKNGKNLLTEAVEKSGGIDFTMPVALGYTGFSDKLLRKYIEDSRILWEGKGDGTYSFATADQLPIHSVGATIGTHIGPGAIALAFFNER